MRDPVCKPRLIVILGPTATGKSSVALEMAEKLKGEIIGADSMQVYRYLDIGTAKPTVAERRRVRHHLIDVVDPDEYFHAGAYASLADGVIERLHRQGNPIFVVGGTGLYLKALLKGLFPAPPPDANIRNFLRKEAERFGPGYLHDQLTLRDPLTAAAVAPNDLARIIRALEVLEISGRSLREQQQEHGFGGHRYEYLKLGIATDRDHLYGSIDRRVEAMIADGLPAEVENLLNRGYGPSLKPMLSLGYRHMVEFLAGKCSLGEATETMKRDTRRYAKRQLTWFRADGEINWFPSAATTEMERQIASFLSPRRDGR